MPFLLSECSSLQDTLSPGPSPPRGEGAKPLYASWCKSPFPVRGEGLGRGQFSARRSKGKCNSALRQPGPSGHRGCLSERSADVVEVGQGFEKGRLSVRTKIFRGDQDQERFCAWLRSRWSRPAPSSMRGVGTWGHSRWWARPATSVQVR